MGFTMKWENLFFHRKEKNQRNVEKFNYHFFDLKKLQKWNYVKISDNFEQKPYDMVLLQNKNASFI